MHLILHVLSPCPRNRYHCVLLLGYPCIARRLYCMGARFVTILVCTASRPNWKKFFPSISRAAIISSQQFYFPTCVRCGSTTDEPHNPLCNFVAERGHGSSLTPDRSTVCNTTLHPHYSKTLSTVFPHRRNPPTLPSHPTQNPSLRLPVHTIVPSLANSSEGSPLFLLYLGAL